MLQPLQGPRHTSVNGSITSVLETKSDARPFNGENILLVVGAPQQHGEVRKLGHQGTHKGPLVVTYTRIGE